MNVSMNITIRFGRDEFPRLQEIKTANGHLLPQDVNLSEVALKIDDKGAHLDVWYYGKVKSTGQPSKRRTNTLVGVNEAWLWHLMPGDLPKRADQIRLGLHYLWPKSEKPAKQKQGEQ